MLVVEQHHVDGGMRFVRGHGDDDALAGGQAVGLDDDRRALGVDVGVGRGRVGEGLELGGRNAVAGHEALGEILGAFELRGCLGRAEDAQAAGAEDIDDAGGQRRFRTDDGQVDVLARRRVGQRVDVGDGQVLQLVLARRAGVAGGDQNLLQAGRLGETPGQRVFAAAGTDDE